ncbi:hypothetical protein CDAR_125501, partial [Caerostris darwini]
WREPLPPPPNKEANSIIIQGTLAHLRRYPSKRASQTPTNGLGTHKNLVDRENIAIFASGMIYVLSGSGLTDKKRK